jgi:hypothetical protein
MPHRYRAPSVSSGRGGHGGGQGGGDAREGGGMPIPFSMAKAWRPYDAGSAAGAAVYLHESLAPGAGPLLHATSCNT